MPLQESETMKTVPYLRLLPCLHFWLAVQYNGPIIVAICKRCHQTDNFTKEDFEEWGALGQAMHKPVRV